MQKKVLLALEEAGIFTSDGLVKEKVATLSFIKSISSASVLFIYLFIFLYLMFFFCYYCKYYFDLLTTVITLMKSNQRGL